MDSKLGSAVGFAMKAGKLKSGDFIVEKLSRAGRAKLVLLDEAASENTREKYTHLCARQEIELLFIPELGRWIGKPGRMTAAVTDQNFANMIRKAALQQRAADSENTRG